MRAFFNNLPRSGMELDGSSKVGGLSSRGGGGGGGGGGGRMHWITECVAIGAGAASSTGARNSLPGGAGSSSRRTTGITSVSYPTSAGSRFGDNLG